MEQTARDTLLSNSPLPVPLIGSHLKASPVSNTSWSLVAVAVAVQTQVPTAVAVAVQAVTELMHQAKQVVEARALVRH
jgi:hypothetical protein